jgi:DMSO reductase anchor subunit
MCYGRLTDGREPACVAACPEQAIQIEIVNLDEWRSGYTVQANAPGLPSADDSISTTRVTMRYDAPRTIDRVDTARLHIEHPHWALIFMTVLTQLAVGTIMCLSAVQTFASVQIPRIPAAAVVLVALFALGASTLHLGRPAYAFRALSMWRRSWLSREVLMFSLFVNIAIIYAALLWCHSKASDAAGLATAFIGCIAVYASARLYRVAARPAWNSAHTYVEFYFTALLTGSLAASMIIQRANNELNIAASLIATLLITQQAAKLTWLLRSRTSELRATGTLIRFRLLSKFAARLSALAVVALATRYISVHAWVLAISLALAIGSEFLGRYLFFVSVVPKSMAAPYMRKERAA